MCQLRRRLGTSMCVRTCSENGCEKPRQRQHQAFPGYDVMKSAQAEIERLRMEVAKLRVGRDLLKKPQPSHQGVDVKFGFMAKHRGIWPVHRMWDALGVSRSGFYAWLSRPSSQRSQDGEVLGEQARQSFMCSDRTYGIRRVWRDVLALGFRCGQHRIERLMQLQGLPARPRRQGGLPKDVGARSAIADNVLDRQFRADGPDQKWVADVTDIWTADGRLYVTAVLDLYSRRVVGWADAEQYDFAIGCSCTDDGRLETRATNAPTSASSACWPNRALHAARVGLTEVWDISKMESFFRTLKTGCTAPRSIVRVRRLAQTCSTTSNASTIRLADIRRWNTSALLNFSKLERLHLVST
ncbi:IS3 family transposase [Pandoraea iniqua]|uniref:IS3 family transposase n=1 Tax=Pandoraea iniqua TaxID=2508288 RepID=A0A5E4YHG3_9BURK|nr:IS3 family transposase [Pandoraea iniqua]